MHEITMANTQINDLYTYLQDLIKGRTQVTPGQPQNSSGPTLVGPVNNPMASNRSRTLPAASPAPQVVQASPAPTSLNQGIAKAPPPSAPGPDVLSTSLQDGSGDGIDEKALNDIVSKDATGLTPMLKKYWPLLLSTLGAVYSRKHQAPTGANALLPLPSDMTNHLQTAHMDRSAQGYTGDYYTYGEVPEHSFFQNNQLPEAGHYARGGPTTALNSAISSDPMYIPSNGSNGRADDIDAKLSPNEYVVDAETMALLGDGNPDAGAKKMDKLRENIRKHKGKKLARGKISPDSHEDAQAYLGSFR